MRRRTAFTIPELLVAMALIMFIMAILAEAFKAGLDSYRQLKAVGDLQEKLRAVTSTLRSDLSSPHFNQANVKPSDPQLYSTHRPSGGFFAVYGGTSPSVPSLILPGVVPSWEMPGSTNPWPLTPSFYFTIQNTGTDRQSYFTAKVPAPNSIGPPTLWYLANQGPQDYWDVTRDTYHHTWSEVAYFVRPNGSFAGNTQLFTLFRRQLTLVTDPQAVASPSGSGLNPTPRPGPNRNPSAIRYSPLNQGLFAGVSGKQAVAQQRPRWLWFNGPSDLGNSAAANNMPSPLNTDLTPNMLNRSLWQTPFGANWRFPPDYPIVADNARFESVQGMLPGDDLLLNDVVEFNLRLLISTPTSPGTAPFDFIDVPASPFTQVGAGPPPVYGTPLPAFDSDAMIQPRYGYVNPTNPGVPYVPLAVQIILRVWDVKTQTTRQVTLVQDL